jgi:hypothetical protein
MVYHDVIRIMFSPHEVAVDWGILSLTCLFLLLIPLTLLHKQNKRQNQHVYWHPQRVHKSSLTHTLYMAATAARWEEVQEAQMQNDSAFPYQKTRLE